MIDDRDEWGRRVALPIRDLAFERGVFESNKISIPRSKVQSRRRREEEEGGGGEQEQEQEEQDRPRKERRKDPVRNGKETDR